MDALPLEVEKQASKSPDLLNRVRAIFRMRSSTPLDRAQETAWKNARHVVSATSEQDWETLEWYYRQSGEGFNFRRQSLATLLNNWNGEIERAHTAAPALRRAKKQSEPEGWREVWPLITDLPCPESWDELFTTQQQTVRQEVFNRRNHKHES